MALKGTLDSGMQNNYGDASMMMEHDATIGLPPQLSPNQEIVGAFFGPTP